VLLELASALRRAGQLATSSAVNDQALAVAAGAADAALIAEAALTYGETGLLQVRHYGTVDDRVVAALARALDATDPSDSVARARLLSGLSLATYYQHSERDRAQDLAREATSMARRLAERTLLASLLVELLLILEDVADQSEQQAAAAELATFDVSELPDDVAPVAVARRARVALNAGHAATLDDDIDRYVQLARQSRLPNERLWSTWTRASVAFLRGRLSEAEQLADQAFALHEQVGSWGGPETYALLMVLVWREQARLAEVAPLVEPMLAQATHPGAAKLRSIFVLERGGNKELAPLLGKDPVPRSRDFTWLTEVCITAEPAAAARLPCAGELYQTLLPYADRVVTMDGPFVCLGSASYYLGLLAEALDKNDDALHHFETALALNDQIGAVPWSVRTRFRLAERLTAVSGDRTAGRRLLVEALELAERHRLTAMQGQVGARLDHLG
jgi:tetratricopeptide (TPR) repeat protein